MDANTDTMTNLDTRAAFDEHFSRCVRDGGEGMPVSLAFLDLDRFLEVNDRYGRDAGDTVLRELGAQLRNRLAGDGARAFRIGGDEFAVVFVGTQKEQAFLALEEARSAFASLPELDHISPHPTISIGVATYPDDGATRQETIRKADDALYRGKSSGRDRVTLAREEKKVPKTTHFTQGQLDRLSTLSRKEGLGEAELLREALDDLLKKYSS
jgi:diguanylate cyclase (GGDEF)-like protein